MMEEADSDWESREM